MRFHDGAYNAVIECGTVQRCPLLPWLSGSLRPKTVLFIEQMFIEHLLCAEDGYKFWDSKFKNKVAIRTKLSVIKESPCPWGEITVNKLVNYTEYEIAMSGVEENNAGEEG